MIPHALTDQIRRLLATETHSMRTIARITGVCRGTVAAIARGARPKRPVRGAAVKATAKEPLGPLERCPECGALAHMPCRACRVRRTMRVRPGLLSRPTREKPLQVELTGEFRQRYEEVRARRIREGPEGDPRDDPAGSFSRRTSIELLPSARRLQPTALCLLPPTRDP